MNHLLRQFRFYVYSAIKSIFSFFTFLFSGSCDYFSFPFDPNQPLHGCNTDTLLYLKSLISAHEKLIYLSDGSLLGVYRDGNLISHDNDLDFYIDRSSLSTSSLISFFSGFLFNGYFIGRLVFNKWKLQQVVFYNRNYFVVDFTLWRKEKLFYWHVLPEMPSRMITPSFLFDSSRIYYVYIDNVPFPTFLSPQQFLSHHYGPSWIIPEKEKSDWLKTAPKSIFDEQ